MKFLQVPKFVKTNQTFTKMEHQTPPAVVISGKDWLLQNAKLERIETAISRIYQVANSTETFTPEETSKILKVSIKTLSNWRERNLISFFQIGSNVRFTKSQIDDFINRNSLKIK